MKEMSIKELAALQKQENLAILDVRDAADFEEQHFEGSLNIPLPELEEKWQELDLNQTYHVVCTKGIRAQKASNFLSQKGYQVVKITDGWGSYEEE